MNENELLSVGDVLVVSNCFGRSSYIISRVTKTLAFSKRDDGRELKFKRKIGGNMSHPSYTWDANRYIVKRKAS